MRVIKPGKVGLFQKVEGEQLSSGGSKQGDKPAIEIWDDFSPPKKVTKKKEYERGSGNRMVPAERPPKPLGERSRSLFSRESEAPGGNEETPLVSDYRPLEERLGYGFRDVALLECALTHRSALWMRERVNYERLEFLGDAVLDLAIADLLSERYGEAREGELSKMRAALVNTEALAQAARALEVGPFIRLGPGERASGGSERPSILADVMEAIIGAIYKDGGFESAHGIIARVFGEALEQVTPSDPKTELQEALYTTGSEPPEYLLELVEGPDHAPVFVVIVVVDGVVVGRGRAPTKKAAQRAAAAEALAKLIPTAPELPLVAGQTAIIPNALLVPAAFALNAGVPNARAVRA